MALSVMRDAPVLVEVANPSSQVRTPRRAIVLAASSAAALYRASGLVLCPFADSVIWTKDPRRSTLRRIAWRGTGPNFTVGGGSIGLAWLPGGDCGLAQQAIGPS
jgi:hypothetical protein